MSPSPSIPGLAGTSVRIATEVWRGPILESRHRLEAAIAGPAGEPFAATPGGDVVTTFRSAAKPFQLVALVERGHADQFGFDDEHLAVMAASHTGSTYHVRLVTEILERIGLSDRQLACGYHEPLDEEARELVRRNAGARSPLYNNCSGKHAGMLAFARAEGWPVEGYERPDHPVQREMLAVVADAVGLRPEQVPTGIDGCSVPVFGAPLSAMARSYARFAVADRDGNARSAAMARIRAAMLAYPRATGGDQRFSTSLMERAGGAIVAKGGAEGLECIGLIGAGLGLAIKCEDGSSRAVAPAVLALLEHFELIGAAALEGLETWRRPVVKNVAGLNVGELRAVVETNNAGSRS